MNSELFNLYSIYISIVVAALSILSLWISYLGYKLSKKALDNSNKEIKNKESNSDLYLINSFLLKLSENEAYFIFNITIKNLSENKNTFNAELLLLCKNKDNNLMSNYSLEFEPNKINSTKITNLTLFENNIRLEDKELKTAWLIFKKPKEALTDKYIEKYTIRIKDIHGFRSEISTHILKEYFNENTKK